MPRPTLPDLFAKDISPHLHQLLLDIRAHPYPTVESPPNVPKRASVALIIRIQPHYAHWPPLSDSADDFRSRSTEDKMNAFFSQDWVQHGEPEILFIKRASNSNDHWTGHIAFPGGRRDPEDKDDCDTAIREAWEEVGIDLKEESGNAIQCGNMTQSVITSSWGAQALMTFCPYVFLLIKPVPPLRLQPTEVASAHWVPIRALLHQKYRSYWLQNTASGNSKQHFGAKHAIQRFITGDMLFAAIRLHPSESKHATENAEYLSTKGATEGQGSNITVPLLFARSKLGTIEDRDASLLLWGLTLGVVGDFVDMLPPYDILSSWVYPSFTALDLRFFLWILSYNYRRRAEREIQEADRQALIAAPDNGKRIIISEGQERYYGRVRSDTRGRRDKKRYALLPNYFKIIQMAGITTAAARLSMIAILGFWLTRKLQS